MDCSSAVTSQPCAEPTRARLRSGGSGSRTRKQSPLEGLYRVAVLGSSSPSPEYGDTGAAGDGVGGVPGGAGGPGAEEVGDGERLHHREQQVDRERGPVPVGGGVHADLDGRAGAVVVAVAVGHRRPHLHVGVCA